MTFFARRSIIRLEKESKLSIRSRKGYVVKNRLEELRKQRGIKQEDLATALEVSRQTIGSLENGRYNPSIMLLELRKMPLLSLNDNEYYIVTNSKFAYEVEDNKDIETITVANKNLKLKGYDTKSYWNSITNTGRFVVVLPDKYVQGLEVSENHLIIDTKEDTDAELENKIKEDMQHQLVKVDENGEINDESYRVNVRGAEIEQQKAMVAIVVSLFMYIAFILISAVGTILAVQSLSDSTKYKYRYLTLRRLGINDKSLFKTIRKQLLILFCVPAISAILCSFVMMSSLNNVYQQILGDKHLYLMYFGLNLIIFFLIYSIYWIATYIGFKRNINEAS